VIIAKMVNISGKNRFENKPILDVSVNKAVINPALIIDQAEALISSFS
jgi:fructose-specific phosphotransferase system component IIB